MVFWAPNLCQHSVTVLLLEVKVDVLRGREIQLSRQRSQRLSGNAAIVLVMEGPI